MNEACKGSISDYANHLWLLTKSWIFPRVSPLINVSLLSFLIKHKLKLKTMFIQRHKHTFSQCVCTAVQPKHPGHAWSFYICAET